MFDRWKGLIGTAMVAALFVVPAQAGHQLRSTHDQRERARLAEHQNSERYGSGYGVTRNEHQDGAPYSGSYGSGNYGSRGSYGYGDTHQSREAMALSRHQQMELRGNGYYRRGVAQPPMISINVGGRRGHRR